MSQLENIPGKENEEKVMFQKKETIPGKGEPFQQEPERQDYLDTVALNKKAGKPVNTVLKGSRITGDIKVSCDVEVSGEVQGNITSEGDAKIHIQGMCKGSLQTEDGDIVVSGELSDGNIISGGSVTVTGSFKGGEISAKDKLSIDGILEGKIKAKEVEIGAKTTGTAEITYTDFISIAKGAKINGSIKHQAKKSEETDKTMGNGRIVSIGSQAGKSAKDTKKDDEKVEEVAAKSNT